VATGLLVAGPGPAAAGPEELTDVQSAEHPRGSAPAPPPEGGLSVEMTPRPGGLQYEIPWNRLNGPDYALVREVVRDATAAREVREISFRSRKPVFDYLLEHLDFAASIARILGEGKYRVKRDGDGYQADDGHGTTGVLRPVFADAGRRVFYLEGQYDPPLLPAIGVRAVLLLDIDHVESPDGATYCELNVAGHVRFDSRVLDTLAWVMRNYTQAQVDKQVRRFFRHVAVVSRRAYDDPESLDDELTRHPELPAREVSGFRHVLLAHRPPSWAETQRYRLIEPLAPAL